MKREIECEERLPAFELQVGELELLWDQLLKLFGQDDKIVSSINLVIPSEKLQFDSLAELLAYKQIRGSVTNFSLKLSESRRSVTIESGGIFNNVPILKVKGESDIWCDGAVATAKKAIRPHRLWYSWLIRAPLLLTFFLISLIPWFFPKVVAMPVSFTVVFFVIYVSLGFLAFTKNKLLPAASLTFTNEPVFIRRYSSEISIVFGVIGIALAFFMWRYPFAA